MKSYEVNTPRAAFALAAVVLATLTIGIAVVWPAHAGTERAGAARLAAANRNLPSVSGIAADSPHVDRIDVMAIRGPRTSVHAIYLRYPRQG
jgi:hypothetical protein